MAYKAVLALLSAGLLFMLFPSPVAQAASNPQCLVFNTKLQKVISDIEAKKAPLAQLRIKTTYANSQVPVVLNTKVIAAQKESDKKIKVIFKKLHTKAKTAAQKTAMKTYETEFMAALTAQRAAQQAARNNYIAVVNNLNAVHRTAVDTQATVLKSKIEIAFNNAVAKCQKLGVVKVTAPLKNDIILAQEGYNLAPYVGVKSIQSSQQVAADNFKAAHNNATAALNQSLQLSRSKLKTAFPTTKYIFE